MKEKILVSSCLLGNNVKYNGGNNNCPLIEKVKEQFDIITVCPEVSGGLPIPRFPSEIQSNNKVVNNQSTDVTKEYQKGANIALELCKKHNIKIAILKEKSPSCGTHFIYNGDFDGTVIEGQGITTNLLIKNDIKVYSENEIEILLQNKK